jgi:formate hydrogenlyase transcriptional activator
MRKRQEMYEPESDDTISVLNGQNGVRSGPPQPGSIYPERRSFDRILVPFTARLMNATVEELDAVVDEGLKHIMALFDGDRALLWELSDDGQEAALTHYHAEPGFEPPVKLHLHRTVPYLFDKILSLQNVVISDLDDLPASADNDRKYLSRIGVRSFLIIPLTVGGDRRGALSLACIRNEREWTNADLFNFQRISMVLAGALDRKRSHRLIDQRVRFETMIADLSAHVLKSQNGKIDSEIERSLARVAGFFHADRCGLLRVDTRRRSAHVSHAYYADGVATVSSDVDLAELFPWTYEELVVRKRPVNVTATQMKDLPPEAGTDQRSWAAMGVKSNLAIPLITGEEVDHIIVIHSLREDRSWPKEYIPRLRLMGELFANALIRKRSDTRRKQTEEELRTSYAEITRLRDKLEAENRYLREEVASSCEAKEIIGRSDVIKYVHFRVNQVASLDTTVLIVGETGTGKGLVAKAVHDASLRRDRQMIHVNCAVLPANLIESELFGREKGAFTGAQAKQIGRFELAHKGTIFLDEIAELPVELQAKLLRVVETGEFERLGDPHTVKVDVRIIASTNRNLEEEIYKGRFREDLFYRLNVFPITVPPLRQRCEDIPLIVDALIERLNKQLGRRITSVPQEVMQALQSYPWPGNVRELENIIERAVIMSRGPVLQLSEQLGASSPHPPAAPETAFSGLAEVERAHIRNTLEAVQWKIEGPKGAAHTLGMKPSTLRDRMKFVTSTRLQGVGPLQRHAGFG